MKLLPSAARVIGVSGTILRMLFESDCASDIASPAWRLRVSRACLSSGGEQAGIRMTEGAITEDSVGLKGRNSFLCPGKNGKRGLMSCQVILGQGASW